MNSLKTEKQLAAKKDKNLKNSYYFRTQKSTQVRNSKLKKLFVSMTHCFLFNGLKNEFYTYIMVKEQKHISHVQNFLPCLHRYVSQSPDGRHILVQY